MTTVFYNQRKSIYRYNRKWTTELKLQSDEIATEVNYGGLHTKQTHAQQQEPKKHLGVTPPICSEEPLQQDLQRTEEMVKALAPFKVFETPEGLNQRMAITTKLTMLLKQWIKDVSIAKNMPIMDAEKLGGKIYTFGSIHLGVNQRGADIDALCVAPRNIERSDFFTSFFALLKMQAEVTKCRAIEKAFVPVIKLEFDGIEIDLVFARLSPKEIPDDFDLRDNDLLRNLDDYSMRSLNGYRITDEILALVPNIENFRLALRAIKLWAKKHGIYSNSLGYFGGVTWAMLMARICQLYPNAAAAALVHRFFLCFSQWEWPRPVLLKYADNVNFRFSAWNPRINISDSHHLMPVITPAYPQQNSTFNVSQSTKKVILNEINRGLAITNEIILGNATWSKLFEVPSFFNKYRHFIVLLVNSLTEDDHVEWCGLVESRIRLLIANLERHQHISFAHVNPKCFDYDLSLGQDAKPTEDATLTKPPICSMWFIGLEFERTENLHVDLTDSIQSFIDRVRHHGETINMFKDGMTLTASHVKRKELSKYLDADFLKSDRNALESESNLSNFLLENLKRRSIELEEQCIAVKRRRSSENVNVQPNDENPCKKRRNNI